MHPLKALVLLALIAPLGLTACARADVVGSGNVASETRAVSGFHGVDLRGSGEVIVTQGEAEGLVIEAEDNILPLIESKVGSDGILRLGLKNSVGSVHIHKEVLFKLAAKTIEKIVIEGSGTVRAAKLAAAHPSIELPGSGEILVDQLQAGDIQVRLDGSGTIKLAGAVRTQKLEIDGSGDYEARDLKSDDISVEINGSGDTQVWARESLAVEINGSGDVSYYGKPKVKKSVNGSGDVRSLGDKSG